MKLDPNNLEYIINCESDIEGAWAVIEKNKHRSAIVLDGNRVVGTVSDGDLRKAMLAHILLSSPVAEVMNTNFIYLGKNETEKAKMLLKKKNIFIIPIVDDDMSLIDIIKS
jgi:CBS domain-containing protein